MVKMVEMESKTIPSILCVTNQMSRKKQKLSIWLSSALRDDTSLNDNSWYFMVLGQYGVVLVGTWWYWVSRGRYWLVHGATGSV